jgi:DNA topoisomerase-1
MRVAQRLYEAGHITYMRTDKAVLCAEAIVEAQGLVTSKYGPEYVGFAASAAEEPTKKKATKAAKAAKEEEPKAQEAHEAIRPTHFDMEVLAGEEWTPLDRNIYKLIRARALQAVMAPARGDSITVKLLPEGEEDDMFWSSTARRTTFQGWRIIGAKPVNDDEESDEASAEKADSFATLSSLKVGSKVRWTSIETQPHITKAAPRYTEATLVKALEQRGIGRPSTFASLLDAIMERSYVEKKNIEGQKVTLNKYSIKPGTTLAKQTFTRALGAEKDRLVPTELGRQMLAFALKHFADLFDYGYTAGLETRLDHISEGKEAWKSVLKETWTSYKDRVTTLSTVTGVTTGGPSKDTVKDLGSGLKAQVTKKGPLLIQEPAKEGDKATFHGWPSGVSFADMTADVARDFIAKKVSSVPVIGQYEGADITLHKGQYGHYVKYKEYNVSVKAEDPLDTIIEKLKAKIGGSGGGAGSEGSKVTPSKVGPFTFSTGPYGPYMYKTDLKTKKFVSVPQGLDLTKLTIREADEIYKKGLEEKEAKAKAGAKFAAIRAAKGH